VTCQAGQVRVIIDEFVMRLEHLKRELADIVRDQTDAERVEVETGPGYRPASMVANVDLNLPQKVLLVDDERDFVLTLSERLQMRDLQPAIANDGEQALSMLRDEAPEVMILDVMMPGIDGIEVLRKVKAEHPQVEVIILTGHGSKRDRDLCLDLGAFAYLEKPVDIEELAGVIKRANERICAGNQADDAEDESAS
jgi:two-component system, OmpR family, response regulator CpxR